MTVLSVLDLFSGIGGFSFGLERTGGFRVAAFCECDPYARQVLIRHWPNVPVFGDVRQLRAADLPAKPNVICGGFPCQDISFAGKGTGLNGDRSGLWFEMLRLITEIRPRWVLVENVSALRSRGLETLLGGLAAIGYDAEWHCIPAATVGAPHRRDRVWVVAHPNGESGDKGGQGVTVQNTRRRDTDRSGISAEVADTSSLGLAQWLGVGSDNDQKLTPVTRSRIHTDVWDVEPDVGRVAYGVPPRVDRLRGLGNAVVPQIPEILGRWILAAERTRVVSCPATNLEGAV